MKTQCQKHQINIHCMKCYDEAYELGEQRAAREILRELEKIEGGCDRHTLYHSFYPLGLAVGTGEMIC